MKHAQKINTYKTCMVRQNKFTKMYCEKFGYMKVDWIQLAHKSIMTGSWKQDDLCFRKTSKRTDVSGDCACALLSGAEKHGPHREHNLHHVLAFCARCDSNIHWRFTLS